MIYSSVVIGENRRLRNIQKCEWPPNSPDLQAIEDLWGPEKSLVRPKLLEIKRASKEVQKKARLVIEEAWSSQKLQDQAQRACDKWPDKLRLCIEKEGDNNFKG